MTVLRLGDHRRVQGREVELCRLATAATDSTTGGAALIEKM